MSQFFGLLAQIFRSSDSVMSSHASHLMESADAMRGLDPHAAEELRSAASAWLSVVR